MGPQPHVGRGPHGAQYVVTNILLRLAINAGVLDNVKLVRVFQLLQIAADALAPTERRVEDETMATA